MDEVVLHWISQYGYAGIFLLLMFGIIGAPIPDETLMIFSGYLVYKGDLAFVATLASAFCGSICGITVSYVLGRTGGYCLFKKYGFFLHFTEERFNRMHDWLEHSGRWGLVFGYFIPGVRHLTAIVAGTSQMRYRVFAALTYTGGLIWSASFITAGFFLGQGWQESSASYHRWILIASFSGAGLALIVYVIFRRRRKIN